MAEGSMAWAAQSANWAVRMMDRNAGRQYSKSPLSSASADIVNWMSFRYITRSHRLHVNPAPSPTGSATYECSSSKSTIAPTESAMDRSICAEAMDRTPASSPSLKMVASSGSTFVGTRRASTDTTARHGANGGGVNWTGTPSVACHSRGYKRDTWFTRSRHAMNPVNDGRGASLTEGGVRSGIRRVYVREAGLQY
jgi:hypothetical protein